MKCVQGRELCKQPKPAPIYDGSPEGGWCNHQGQPKPHHSDGSPCNCAERRQAERRRVNFYYDTEGNHYGRSGQDRRQPQADLTGREAMIQEEERVEEGGALALTDALAIFKRCHNPVPCGPENMLGWSHWMVSEAAQKYVTELESLQAELASYRQHPHPLEKYGVLDLQARREKGHEQIRQIQAENERLRDMLRELFGVGLVWQSDGMCAACYGDHGAHRGGCPIPRAHLLLHESHNPAPSQDLGDG